MLSTIRKLLELIRFSHTLFALPFALLAAVMAWSKEAELYNQVQIDTLGAQVERRTFINQIRWQELAGILFCMVFARSAAMAFNRLADRQIDAKNPRTASRHLPHGDLSVPTVAAFAAA